MTVRRMLPWQFVFNCECGASAAGRFSDNLIFVSHKFMHYIADAGHLMRMGSRIERNFLVQLTRYNFDRRLTHRMIALKNSVQFVANKVGVGWHIKKSQNKDNAPENKGSNRELQLFREVAK